MLYRHSAILWEIHMAWSVSFPATSGSIISYSISTGKVSGKKLIWITFSLNSVSICSIRRLPRILSRQKLFRRKCSSSFHEEIHAAKLYNFKSNNRSCVVKISWYEFLTTILENYLWRSLILSQGFFSYFEHFCGTAIFGIIASKIYHCYIIIIQIQLCFTLSFFYILHWSYIFLNLHVSSPER